MFKIKIKTWECDREASTMRRPRPTRAVEPLGKKHGKMEKSQIIDDYKHDIVHHMNPTEPQFSPYHTPLLYFCENKCLLTALA
jgi:hypothetical protein